MKGCATAALVLALSSLVAEAEAYVRSRSQGTPVRWLEPELVVHLYDPGPASGFTLGELEKAARAAVSGWISPCTRMRVELMTHAGVAGIAKDGRNVIAIRTKRWCPDSATHQRQCYDPRLWAQTKLYPQKGPLHDGERVISEVDLELNAVDYRWRAGSADGSSEEAIELEGVLLHEFGHVFGLDHDCGSGEAFMGADAVPRRLPSCAATLSQGSAMHPGSDDLARQLPSSPTAQERQALCDLYPRRTCSWSGQAGCDRASCLLVVPLVFVYARRRRRSSSMIGLGGMPR